MYDIILYYLIVADHDEQEKFSGSQKFGSKKYTFKFVTIYMALKKKKRIVVKPKIPSLYSEFKIGVFQLFSSKSKL